MKLLSIEEAQAQFADVCEEALAGEVIRLQHPGGLLELKPVASGSAFSEQELAASYQDADWARFENQCGKASD